MGDAPHEVDERAELRRVLAAVAAEARVLAHIADEALRTGDWARLADFDLTRAHAARDALLEALRDLDRRGPSAR